MDKSWIVKTHHDYTLSLILICDHNFPFRRAFCETHYSFDLLYIACSLLVTVIWFLSLKKKTEMPLLPLCKKMEVPVLSLLFDDKKMIGLSWEIASDWNLIKLITATFPSNCNKWKLLFDTGKMSFVNICIILNSSDFTRKKMCLKSFNHSCYLILEF